MTSSEGSVADASYSAPMAYLKPNFFVRRIFNPVAMKLGFGGVKTLVVPGRSTGRPQRIPVITVEQDGSSYLVSTRGETDWVRNVRAAGSVELGGDRLRVAEVPAAERPPILAAYKVKAGRTV